MRAGIYRNGKLEFYPIKACRTRPRFRSQRGASDTRAGLTANFDYVIFEHAPSLALRSDFHAGCAADDDWRVLIPYRQARLVLDRLFLVSHWRLLLRGRQCGQIQSRAADHEGQTRRLTLRTHT